MTQFTLAI